ncbi:PLP-dependent transferase [Candidatus Nasuia deltocephalinicola]|uniref:PLP-dependent transferase n=1 Tax=Candidatus Nasuia deltocephalincola TaxID=1160784 RepID=UPI00216ADB04|nr:PLP-dependent transferase [Candidatus Nasuia deltocephalinicola]
MFLKTNSLLKSNNLKNFFRENSDVLFLNSSFCFKSCYYAEKFFKFSNFYNIYSRFSNPTVYVMEKKIAFFEKSKYCISFSSGMAAIVSLFINFLFSGNIFYTSLDLFGSTLNFFSNILYKFNIIAIFVNFFNINSLYYDIFFIKLFFFETPSNPLLKLFNIYIISYISLKYCVLFIIDNTFASPVLQNPNIYNVSFTIHSCTKFFDGHGRVLGGVVVTNNYFLFLSIFSFLRFSGFNISCFNAWVILKSLECLFIRIKNQIYNSYFFLKIFKYNLFVLKLFNSGYLNYYNYKIFNFQQIFNNSVFSFLLKGNTLEMMRINSWKIVDNIFLLNTANLGDVSTLITNCSITTHISLSFIEKIFLNIFDSLLRISFGLEDIFDLYYSLSFSFNNI